MCYTFLVHILDMMYMIIVSICSLYFYIFVDALLCILKKEVRLCTGNTENLP